MRAGDEFAAAAAKTLRAGIAVLDREGRIRWVNDAWARATAAVPILAGAAGGVRISIAVEERGGAVVMCAEPAAALTAAPVVRRVDVAQLAERLTPREREVLARLADGLDNRTIAKQLGVEYSTVRGYVRSLIDKLGARSRVDVVGIAYRTGLVRRTEVER